MIYRALGTISHLLEALGWETGAVYGVKHVDETAIAGVETLKADRLARKLSRQQVRVEEFDGVIRDQYADRFARCLTRFLTARHAHFDLRQIGMAVRDLSSQAVEDFRRDRLGKLLPQASLMSELSALYFANSQVGQLTDNDFVDWQHAAVAVPHSHAFFTERRLRGQLANLHAGERYGCEVFSSEEAALDFLRK